MTSENRRSAASFKQWGMCILAPSSLSVASGRRSGASWVVCYGQSVSQSPNEALAIQDIRETAFADELYL